MVNLSQAPPRPSYDSQATASDATDDGEKIPMERYRDSPSDSSIQVTKGRLDADDFEADIGALDEEVGLMQADRDGSRRRRAPMWARLRRTSIQTSKKRPTAFAGCLIFTSVVIGFMLGLPLLQWLSSNYGNTASTSVASTVTATTADKVDAPLFAPPSNNSSKFTSWKRPSSLDNAAGHYALADTDIFKVDFQTPGWNTFAQAAAGTGLSEHEVAGIKTHDGHDLMPLDMDTVFGGTLAPQISDLTWSEEDPDEGVFSHVDWTKRDIWLEDVTHARHEATGQGKVASFGGKSLIVEGKNVLDHRGRMLGWTSFKFSPDVRWVLFFSSETKQWRYSQKSYVWLHNIATKKTVPLGSGPTVDPKISFAAWEPKKAGSTEAPGIAFVEENNLYFIPRAGEAAVRITEDGAATIFNAVPDWVYEEEVYGSDSVMWFSPGGSKLVYLRLDETTVPVYEFPVYNPDPYRAGQTTPYQKMTQMKYPKPGYPNPIVSVKMIDLDEIREATRKGSSLRPTMYTLHSPMTSKGKTDNEVDKLLSSDSGVKQRLVTEVKWVSDNELLVRETDRYSDVMRIVNFDLSLPRLDKGKAAIDIVGEVVRRQDARADKTGWIDAAQTIEPLSHHNLSVGSTAYLDIAVSPEGFRHLAYYDSATSDRPTYLTSGHWEIASLKHVDARRGRAYFIAARPTPALRNLYYVDLPDWKNTAVPASASYEAKEPIALTDVSKPGSYGASFDPKGAYYLLNYQGPDVPYQKILGVDDPSFSLVLEENTLLRQMSSQYVKPSSTFYQLVLNSTMADGSRVVASVQEIRPHDFDASGATQYPVLIRQYSGPDSQLVDARWNRADWHQYVASNLGYIVAVVDVRGTGFRGQAYRAAVAGKLGDVEAQDVNNAASLLSTLPYVDASRVGIWGWSYGGYLTAKAVELSTFPWSLAVSVAPVTNWLFYDSIYTERYMKSPANNKAGYTNAAVHISQAFQNTKFLLIQGSADDNVHFANSAHLLDLLTKAKIRGFRFRMFTDSAHSISVRGAYRELFEEISAFLRETWGPGGKREPVKKGKNRPSLHNSVE